MGTCNTDQKEVGGKNLLLKVCKELTYATTNGDTEIVSVGHGLKVGDLWKPKTVGANTTINTNTYYLVKEVVDADTFKVSVNKAGAAISMDATGSGFESDGFVAVGGIRSKSLSLQSEAIEITSEDSDEYKELLDKAGIKSASISGSGVYNNGEMLGSLEDAVLSGELQCIMLVNMKSGRLYVACYKLASFEVSGDYNAEGNFSISAESSGAITKAVLGALV